MTLDSTETSVEGGDGEKEGDENQNEEEIKTTTILFFKKNQQHNTQFSKQCLMLFPYLKLTKYERIDIWGKRYMLCLEIRLPQHVAGE